MIKAKAYAREMAYKDYDGVAANVSFALTDDDKMLQIIKQVLPVARHTIHLNGTYGLSFERHVLDADKKMPSIVYANS